MCVVRAEYVCTHSQLNLSEVYMMHILPPEDITFTGRVTVRNLVLRGVLQGPQGSVDIVARLADAVRLQDTAITITGRKVFTAGLSFGNLHVEILNGRKLDHFLALVVTRNRPHTLTGAVTVRGTITAPWVTAQQLAVQVLCSSVLGVSLNVSKKKKNAY